MKARKAFTIIELLTVMAVISILVTIVVVATNGALKSARLKRAESMRIVLEQAISAYYAQEGKWPQAIESQLGSIDTDTYTLSESQADALFQQIVKKSCGKDGRQSVLVDVSALFVCEASNCGNGNKGCYDQHVRGKDGYCGNGHCRPGLDFSEAVKNGSKRHLSISQMAFGYPGAEYGKFCRFWVTYNSRTDAVTVSLRKPKGN